MCFVNLCVCVRCVYVVCVRASVCVRVCTFVLYMCVYVCQVQQYHEAGAKLTVTGTNGWTAMHHAARLGKYEIVQYLVQHCKKFIVFSCDIFHETILHTQYPKKHWI